MVNGFEIVIPNLYEMEYTFADVTENHTIDAYFTHIGIDENKNNKNFMVSPNPADTYIDIAIENENFAIPAEALIVDMRGRILQQIKLGNITQRIDISKLQAEYYFITIKANNNFTTKKFIKR